MGNIDTATLVIIAITSIVSLIGWQNRALFDRLKFQMDEILKGKQYYRMLTSALLHADLTHLLFNMITFYFFAPIVVRELGSGSMVWMYILSVLAGSWFSILFHKNEDWYTAVGASGGVSGILFSSIIINPTMSIYIFFIPIPIPAWIFGIFYLGYSIFGMRTRQGNIGHAAHLGGAFAGLVMTLILEPGLFQDNIWYVLGLSVPLAFLGYYAYQENKKVK